MHQGCNCTSVPIYPGARSLPFIDYRETIKKLETEQQHAVLGKNNWILYSSGIIRWEDIVFLHRVREFHEVMDRQGHSVETMVKAGVSEEDAKKAWDLVHTPERQTADRQRAEAIQGLAELGLSTEDIVKAASSHLAGRIAAPQGKRGPSKR